MQPQVYIEFVVSLDTWNSQLCWNAWFYADCMTIMSVLLELCLPMKLGPFRLYISLCLLTIAFISSLGGSESLKLNWFDVVQFSLGFETLHFAKEEFRRDRSWCSSNKRFKRMMLRIDGDDYREVGRCQEQSRQRLFIITKITTTSCSSKVTFL